MRLIEQVWFNKHPAKWCLVPLLLPFSLLFLCLSTLRRIFYRLGIFNSFKVSVPVVVVGNIGIGGNGKTPVVLFLIEQCIKNNIKVGVISRGYGGNAPYYPYLLKESSTAAEAGDEPILIYNRCRVPIAVGADRVASANMLITQGCELILADDGLQHYRLERELELIIVDATRRFGNGLLLPAGPLREGKWRLNKVDFVIANGKKNTVEDSIIIDDEISMTLSVKTIVNLLTGEQILLKDFINKNVSVNAIAGIGDPQRFFSTLKEQRFLLEQAKGYVDHHKFCLDDFKEFDDIIPLLMTEKDAVKCKHFSKINWWYVPVSAEFNEKQIAPLISDIIHLTKKSITV